MLHFIIGAAILGVVPAIFIWPHLGVLAWYWIGLMNPHRWAWGPVETLGYAAIFAAVTMVAWAVSKEPKRIRPSPVVFMLAVLAAWITVTTFAARLPEAAWPSWEQAIKILLLTFVTIGLITTRERLHALIWLMVISLGYYGFKGGLFTILTGGEHRVWGPEKSFFQSNNSLAMALIMVLPFTVYLYGQTENRFVRYGLAALAIVNVFSIVGSQSRGAFLALAAMGAFLVLKSRYRLRLGAVALAMGAMLAMFVPAEWVERMQTIQHYEEDASALSRLHAWKFAIEAARDNPLTGGGFNVFFDDEYYFRLSPNADEVFNFHSVYFEVLGEQGFIGLAIFGSLIFVTWRTFSSTARLAHQSRSAQWAVSLSRMGQVSLVGYCCAGAFLNLAFFDLIYLIIAIAPITYGVVCAELQPAPSRQYRRSRGRGEALHQPGPQQSA